MPAASTFLNRLANVNLMGIKLFETAQIKDLDKSPCKNSTTVVVDFDKSKIEIVKYLKYLLICSCDVLVIDENNHRIDFIELKSLNNILKYSNFDAIDEFKTKIQNLNLKNKIVDSNHLVQSVVFLKSLGFTKADRVEYTDIPKRYIIVFDFESAKEFVFGSFAFLTIKNTLIQVIDNEIKSAELYNIGSPIFKNCSTIDDFYKTK